MTWLVACQTYVNTCQDLRLMLPLTRVDATTAALLVAATMHPLTTPPIQPRTQISCHYGAQAAIIMPCSLCVTRQLFVKQKRKTLSSTLATLHRYCCCCCNKTFVAHKAIKFEQRVQLTNRLACYQFNSAASALPLSLSLYPSLSLSLSIFWYQLGSGHACTKF